MIVTVVTPPTDLAVSLADAKMHLRVDTGDEDALILGCITAAQAQIDGPNGTLGRCINVQTLELASPNALLTISMPYPPITSIISITYGAGTVVDPSLYTLGLGGLLKPTGISWPWGSSDWTGVRIRYEAGYVPIPENGGAPARSTAPAAIQAAIKLMVSDLYGSRDGKVSSGLMTNPTIANLLAPYRIFSL